MLLDSDIQRVIDEGLREYRWPGGVRKLTFGHGMTVHLKYGIKISYEEYVRNLMELLRTNDFTYIFYELAPFPGIKY